jgi:hypothetical protein
VRTFAAVAALAALLAVGAAAHNETKRGHLRVSERLVGGLDPYIEGSIGYVRIRTRAGKLVASGKFSLARRPLRFALRPGTYRLFSFQRPCDGNCGFLDPPTDRCSRLFRVRAREAVSATILLSPGKGCTIRLTPRSAGL